MKIISVTLAVMLALASPAWSTPIPRPQLFPETPTSQTETSVPSKRHGIKEDLEPQGTFGLNVFASPLGGVYSGIGAMNPYSNGLGSIGTAYGVNQMNTLGSPPGGYYGAAGGLGALGAGLGAGGGGLGTFGTGFGAGAMNPATLSGLSGLGGFGGLGSYPSYPFGGGLINGALYSDSRGERLRRKLIKVLLEKLNKRKDYGNEVGILQGYLMPVGMNFGLGQAGYPQAGYPQAGYPLAGYPGGIVG